VTYFFLQDDEKSLYDLLYIASQCKAKGITCIFFLPSFWNDNIQKILDEGHQCFYFYNSQLNKAEKNRNTLKKGHRTFLNQNKNLYKNSFINDIKRNIKSRSSLYKIISYIKVYKNLDYLSKRLIKNYNPNLLVSDTDCNLMPSIFVKNFSVKYIPTFIIQWAHFSPTINDLAYWSKIKSNKRSKSILYHILYIITSVVVPRSKFYLDGQLILRTNPEIILVSAYFGVYVKYPWTWGGGMSDFKLVSGTTSKEKLIEYGIDRNKIIVSGQPRMFLSLNDSNYINSSSIRDEMNDGNKIILFIGSGNYNNAIFSIAEHRDNVNFIINELFLINKNHHIVVKTHPNEENISDYNFLRATFNNKVRVIDNYDILKLINKSSLVITENSSAVVYALAKVPVISFNFTDIEFLNYNKSWKLTKMHAESKDDFKDLLKKVFFDKNFRAKTLEDQKTILDNHYLNQETDYPSLFKKYSRKYKVDKYNKYAASS